MTQTLPDDLTSAARSIYAAQKSARLTGALLRRGDTSGAEEATKEAERRAGDALGRLQAAGVTSQALTGIEPANPLRLDQLDTPDVRALLDGVRALVPLAERVDRARGRWYPDAPDTDTKGTDTAEYLHQLACRLHLEAFGPNTGKE